MSDSTPPPEVSVSTHLQFALADRLGAVGFSEIVKVRNQILEMRSRGDHVFQFEGGEPFPDTPEHIKAACIEALRENRTRYAPSSGISQLIDALAEKVNRKNNIPAKASEVIVVNGGMQGLFGAFQSVINKDDEVLVFSPYWTPIRDLIRLTRGDIVTVDTRRARVEGFREVVEAKVTPRTRCIYVNTPQNPTGYVFDREELEAIASVARTHNLLVIADEAYEDITYDTEHVSIASLPGMHERTITCFTFSKSFAMTGWRLGYAVAPEPFMSGLKKLTLTTTNGVSTPTQWAGLAAITTPSDFGEVCRREYKTRRDLLVDGLRELGFECETPRGAFYAFPNAKRFGTDSWQIATSFLQRAKVACLPGVIFGQEGEGYLRFSYSTSIETIERGLAALRVVAS
jgi:aspartate/methionine/tyrosine aminotransferase